MGEYRFATHAEIADRASLHQALSDLNGLTFGHYSGVVVASPSFMAWYTARPGMDPRLCQAALAGDQLVSSLFVTLVPMGLAGEMVPCGLIDTVMTHPDHRRRGLARQLLEQAIAAMKEAGAGAGFLNTAQVDPPAGPQRLYESLGYCAYSPVDRFVKSPPHEAEAAPATRVAADDAARAVFTQRLGCRSGWIALDEALWRWRRLERPSQYPAAIYRGGEGGLGVICTGDLLVEGQPRPFSAISDLAPSRRGQVGALLRSLLAAAPRDAPATVLCPHSDTCLAQALHAADFRPVGTEIGMLLPLSSKASALVQRPPSEWYVAVESIIGI